VLPLFTKVSMYNLLDVSQHLLVHPVCFKRKASGLSRLLQLQEGNLSLNLVFETASLTFLKIRKLFAQISVGYIFQVYHFSWHLLDYLAGFEVIYTSTINTTADTV